MHSVTRPVLTMFLIAVASLTAVTYLTPHIYTVYKPEHYLGIHIFLELISIVISFALVHIVWLTKDRLEDRLGQSIIIIGLGFFAIGTIDLLHTLVYQGMPDFLGASSAQRSSFLWLYSRFIMATVITIAILWQPIHSISSCRLSAITLSLATLLSLMGLVLSTWYIDLIPPLYLEGQGLTTLNITLEYILIAIFAADLALLRSQRQHIRPSVAVKVAYFLVFSIATEAAFTFCGTDHDIYTLLGHLYKFIAAAFLFQAIYLLGVLNRFYNLSEMAKLSAELLRESILLHPIMQVQAKKIKELLPQAERIVFYAASDEPDRFLPSYQWGKYGELFPRHEGVYIKQFRKVLGSSPTVHTNPGELLKDQKPGDFSPLLTGLFQDAHQLLYMPLTVERQFYGFILIYIFKKSQYFESEDLEKAELFQKFAALSIAQVRNQELITKLSYEDGLTGLANRRRFFEELNKARYDQERYGTPFTVVYIDMNDLKILNDTLGHEAGDEALQTTARLLNQLTRQSDLPARLGGDEFAILFHGMNLKEAQDRITALRSTFSAIKLAKADRFISLAVGGASYPEEATTTEQLLSLADDRMYEYKRKMKGERA